MAIRFEDKKDETAAKPKDAKSAPAHARPEHQATLGEDTGPDAPAVLFPKPTRLEKKKRGR